jgi:integrase
MAASFAEAVALKQELVATEGVEKPTRTRFAAYVERWIEVHAEHLAPSTRERYAVALAHASVALGKLYVDALRPSDVREWIHRAGKDNAPATVNGWLRVLRVVLDPAVEDEVLPSNPARSVHALRERRTQGPRGTALSVKQFHALLTTTEAMSGKEIAEDTARMIAMLAWTGMRRGELLALRFDDLVDGELHVERSVWGREEKSTKTDDPRRVTVIEPVDEILKAQRRWLMETEHPGLFSGLVFPAEPRAARAGAARRGADEPSWFRSPSVLDIPLRKVVEKAGVPAISPHSFRRTWEDILRKAGVDELVRRSMAGWRTDTAQAIYATVDREERGKQSAKHTRWGGAGEGGGGGRRAGQEGWRMTVPHVTGGFRVRPLGTVGDFGLGSVSGENEKAPELPGLFRSGRRDLNPRRQPWQCIRASRGSATLPMFSIT